MTYVHKNNPKSESLKHGPGYFVALLCCSVSLETHLSKQMFVSEYADSKGEGQVFFLCRESFLLEDLALILKQISTDL